MNAKIINSVLTYFAWKLIQFLIKPILGDFGEQGECSLSSLDSLFPVISAIMLLKTCLVFEAIVLLFTCFCFVL